MPGKIKNLSPWSYPDAAAAGAAAGAAAAAAAGAAAAASAAASAACILSCTTTGAGSALLELHNKCIQQKQHQQQLQQQQHLDKTRGTILFMH